MKLRAKARLCPRWFIGYQTYRDSIGMQWLELFAIPGIALCIGWRNW